MPAALGDNLSYCIMFKVALCTSFSLRVVVPATGQRKNMRKISM